jgi:type I restriction enzyme M protein
MLPKQLFYNTGIPACIWFIDRDKGGNGDRERKNEVLFIDASEIGHMRDRTHREFKEEDIKKISDIYHTWKKKDGDYEDVKGLCKSSTLEEIEKNNWVLTPGRYVGIPEVEDDGIPYEEKMTKLVKELKRQMKESKELDKKIEESLEKVGFGMDEVT